MSKKTIFVAAIAMIAAATTAHAQTNAAPGSANDVTKQVQKDSTAGTNPATDQGIKVPDKTDSSLSGKVQRDSPAVRSDNAMPTDQGPVKLPKAGEADPKQLPGMGNAPRGG